MKSRITKVFTCHPTLYAGLIMSTVGVAFNVSHGWHLGGSDLLRQVGMAGMFLGAIILKDALLGKIGVALKARRYGLALLCLVGFLLGAVTSFIAAFGSASEGRDEKSDPRAAQIVAYKTAEAVANDAQKRLVEIGRTANVAEAKANVARLLGSVDAGIAKRTGGCVNLKPEGAGKRQIAANAEACQPIQDALATVAKAEEATALRAKLDAARDVVSKGAPKAADPLAANLASLWSKLSGTKDGIDPAALLSLIAALAVEIGAPVSWAIWQVSGPAKVETFSDPALDAFRAQLHQPLPDRDGPSVSAIVGGQFPENNPPKPRKRASAPTFSGNVVSIASHPVIKALKENGGSVSSNRELARLMDVTDGEASKRCREIEGMIAVHRVGKECRISLRAG